MIADAKKLLSGYYQPEQLKALYEEGYAVALPLRSYFIWYRNLPHETRQFIDDWWGHPMKYDGLVDIDGQPAFVFPLLKRGNLWLLPQPPRSGKVGHAIHSTVEPPSHLYLAAYLWLQREHNKGELDALVHLAHTALKNGRPAKPGAYLRMTFRF
ncbi:cobN-like chelatase btuS for metalloporphyrine salvage [Vibrio ishigakensis]|uniref:CobN-like chelatase btuS for metalloporphyrine salvage n=1 Tax=Vibrio ishigakensis TaxID=1481914 RepID=A0A0B8P0N8_9VIBR|nr:cobN-like chelatase btuS for metalloporphyrine salvage [Vibrio ishigakensis]